MGKFSTRCKCAGGRCAGRWVKLIPQPIEPAGVIRKSVRLKCLTCGWKFSKRAEYAHKLPEWREHSRKGLTDADILSRIVDGTLVVDVDRAVVVSRQRQPLLDTVLRIIERTSNGSTYQFVEVSKGGKKKKIALHRLVWMAAHRELVPAGFDVDHRFGKSVENPNGIWNLRLLPMSENRAATFAADSEF